MFMVSEHMVTSVNFQDTCDLVLSDSQVTYCYPHYSDQNAEANTVPQSSKSMGLCSWPHPLLVLCLSFISFSGQEVMSFPGLFGGFFLGDSLSET